VNVVCPVCESKNTSFSLSITKDKYELSIPKNRRIILVVRCEDCGAESYLEYSLLDFSIKIITRDNEVIRYQSPNLLVVGGDAKLSGHAAEEIFKEVLLKKELGFWKRALEVLKVFDKPTISKYLRMLEECGERKREELLQQIAEKAKGIMRYKASLNKYKEAMAILATKGAVALDGGVVVWDDDAVRAILISFDPPKVFRVTRKYIYEMLNAKKVLIDEKKYCVYPIWSKRATDFLERVGKRLVKANLPQELIDKAMGILRRYAFAYMVV